MRMAREGGVTELKIKPSQIKIGYAIKLPCSWTKHPFLSASFMVENQQQIAIIQTIELDFVFFYPEKSNIPKKNEQASVTPTDEANIESETQKLHQLKQQRIDAAKAHRAALQKTEKAFVQTLEQVKSVMQMLGSRPLNAIEDSQKMVQGLTQTIMNAQSMVISLMVNSNKEEQNFYSHCLNVSVLSMLLAGKMEMNEAEIAAVGMGALFHDIGKLKIPSQITRKKTGLTQPELNLLKMHPRYGIELINLAKIFPETAKVIILQHHEYADGTGYPSGLKGDQIDKLSRIVNVVNEFENLCHPLDETKARSPHHALSFMFTQMKTKFHHETLAAFIRLMGIYPPGTIVQLTDQRIGMVMSANSSNMTFPEVLVYDADIPRLEAPIIVLGGNLKIEKVANTKELAPEILYYLNPKAQSNYFFDTKHS
jgi:putative nucleotidyltransferase with HDIG domain